MKKAFILWDKSESDSVDSAIKNKKYTVLYNYITENSEEYFKLILLFQILETKNILNDPETVTEVSWITISS